MSAPGLFCRWMSVLSGIALVLNPTLAAAQSVPAGVNQIIPDGRTATTVTTSGSVTGITTTTTAGPNAFNSFSQFKVGGGNTVNLYVPGGSANLINVVRDGAVVVDGVLNSYKNGQIGGNVFFADPYGFVVGKSGVINTGSLTVTTPTREFVDSLIGPGGQISAAATHQLLNGEVPLSPDGAIAIRGRINADLGVRLIGQTVAVGPGQGGRNGQIVQAAKFAATVNSKGLRNASGIVVKNGSIRIVAGDSARINGRLAARSQGSANEVTVTAGKKVTLGAKAKLTASNKNGDAGNVTVKAGQDIAVAAGATLAARSGAGKGGNITVFADGNLTVQSGARLDVSSAQSDAGFAELSAKNTATIGIVEMNFTAPNGRAGTLLIDPYDLVIGGASTDSGSSNDYATSSSILSNGANVVLTADNSITINVGGVIDTRVFNRNAGALSASNASTASSGSVSLIAPNIMVYGQILTNVVNSTSNWSAGNVTLTASLAKSAGSSSHTAETAITIFSTGVINAGMVGATGNATAGDIAMLATSTSTNFSGPVTANADIVVSGRLTGRDVTAQATSTATANYTQSAVGTMALIGETLAASALGINGGYVAGNARATVKIESTATVTAARDVTLESQAYETAANPAMVLGGGGSPVGAAAVVGMIDATVSTRILAGATVQAGGNLAVKAANEARLAVSALVATVGIVDATVAYSKVRVDTTADIAAGAIVRGNNVSVVAWNDNSFSTSATVIAIGAGSIGAAVAYSDIGTHATANFGANLGASNAAISGNLSVEAFSNTTKMSTGATVAVGNNALINGLIGDSPSALVLSLLAPLFGSELGVKVAGALALTSSDQSATASIGGGPGAAPAIYAAGDVSVISRVIDAAIRSNADAGTTSKAADGNTTVSVSAGVAYGTYTHTSEAIVGHGAAVAARNIGVSAKTLLPNENTWVQSWTDWSNPADIFSHLNGNAGVVNNILTSYANATASGATGLAVAGAVNFFAVRNDTTAWVATDAHLTQSGGGNPGWSTRQSNGDFLDWAAPVTVTATTEVQTINIAGNFSIFSLTGSGSDGSAVGGTINMVFYDNTTIAGIARGAVVSSDKWVAVSAYTRDLFFVLAPTSGVAQGSLALNGVVSYAGINDTTHASIDNLARVSAPTVSVKATENLSLLSLAGAVTSGGTAGVGLSNAVLVVAADTVAYVGPNAAEHPDASSTAATGGGIYADSFSVNAVTTGRLTSASIAAAESDPASEGKSFAGKMTSAIGTATSFADPSQLSTVVGVIATAKSAAQTASSGAPPSFSIDIAGSTSVTLVELDTRATVTGAMVDRFTTTGATPRVDTEVQALNNTVINAGSGAAALNFSGSPATTSVAIAGAMAVGILANATTASIDFSTIDHAGDVTVRALGSGEATMVGLGLAVAASGGQNSSAASLSGSVGLIEDSVSASIGNSNITGVALGTGRDLLVQSYQTTDIGVGAGALYAGNRGGVGVAVTYVAIGDPSATRFAADAHLASTRVNGFDTLTISAVDAARIASGAAVAGGQVSSTGVGLTGAVVVNDITPTISAAITGNAAAPIRLTGDLVVTASGARNGVLDAKVRGDTTAANGTAPPAGNGSFDFTAADLVTGGTSSGAAILSVAGQIQVGGNNFGASLVDNTISQSYLATIGQADIETSGDIYVTAADTSNIVGVAVGAALATGPLAASGSLVVNRINDIVTAQIGGAGSTVANTIVKGSDVSVAAAGNASIKSAAGTIVVSVSSGSVGLSSVYNSIGNSVTAAVDGGKIEASRSVVVSALSTSDIQAVAIGAAFSQTLSLSGSVATNILSTDVTARVSLGADIVAENNVGVLAANTDTIHVIAGADGVSVSATGLGASVVVNQISGTTLAYVSGGTTKVDAKAADLGDDLLVNSGVLAHAIDLGAAQAPTYATPDLTETQQVVNGVAVVATSHQAVAANAASRGVSGSIAAGLTAVTNIMGGTTQAYIDAAQIDTRLTAAAGANAPRIELLASSYSYAGNFALGIAGSGSSSGGAAAVGLRFDRRTYADITGAQIGSVAIDTATTNANGTTVITRTHVPTVGAVRVRAIAEQDASNIVTAGGVGGSAGIAAAGVVALFNADTQAYVHGDHVTAQSLAVAADSRNGLFAAAGAGAYGGSLGVGAAFVVAISTNNTLARVGDSSVTTRINLTGALDVRADSANTFNAYAIGGALAGSAGIAGMANVTTISNTTRAGLYNVNVNAQPATIASGVAGTDVNGNPTLTYDYTTQAANPSDLLSTRAGDVTVAAHEDIAVFQVTGALAIGGSAGIGAGVGVAVIKSAVMAETANTNIASSGTVAVNAGSTKTVEAWEVTAAAGFSVGIGAAVGVIVIGTNSTDADGQADQNAQAGGTVAEANSLAASTNVGAPSTTLGGATDGITARVAGGTIAANVLNVAADGEVRTKSNPLGAGFAYTVGVGAAVGYTSINSVVQAHVVPTALTVSSLSVHATMGDHGTGHAADQQVVAGGGALIFGSNASTSVVSLDNSVTADIGGSINAGSIDILAADSSSARAVTTGSSAGIVGVGSSVATATKTSDVHAAVQASSTVLATGAVTLNATESGLVYADATAMAGGVAAGNGAAATATDNGTVRANIGGSASVTYGSLTVAATAAPEVSANSLGVAIGAMSVGTSIALATVNETVTAKIDDGVTLVSAGPASILATLTRPNGGNNARANSIAGAGGLLNSASASVATAETNADVLAAIGLNVRLALGDVAVTARNDSSQYASSTGVTISYVAAGGNASNAVSHGTVRAYVDLGLVTATTRVGALSVVATGNKNNSAETETGSGGMQATAAGVATTRDDTTTTAEIIGDGTLRRIYAGDITVAGSHNSTFTGIVNATQAAALGFSGAIVRNTVHTPVTATVGNALRLNAYGDITLTAYNEAFNANSRAVGGGGGVINGQAVDLGTSINNATTVNVGTGTWLSVNGDPLLFPGKIDIEAWNRYTERAYVMMSAGGVFQGGGAVDKLSATISNTVNIGQNAVLFSVGQIQVGTATIADIEGRSLAQIWGVIGGAGAETDLHYNVNQSVTLATGTKVQAYDRITLNAGQLGNGNYGSRISIAAHTDLYNNTAIPITALARGTAATDTHSTLTLASGVQVLGVGNVALGAYEATTMLDGTGTEHDPYLGIFSSATHNDNNEKSESASVVINGTVAAGTHARQIINISEAGVVTRGDSSDNTLVLVDATLLNRAYISAEANYIYYAQGAASYPQAEALARIAELTAQRATATGAALDRINGQLTALQAIVGTLAVGPVTTIAFGDLFASGGDIDIRSTSLSGSGSLTANGAARITINHDSPTYLAMSNMVIANTQGGQIRISGGQAPPSLTSTRGDTTTAPQITINANYQASRAINDPPPDPPLILLQGVVSNLNGNVAIFNKFGNLTVYNSLDAASININLPNGRMVVDLGDQVFSTGGSISSIMANYAIKPMTPTELVYYAANAEFNANGQYTTDHALSSAIYDSPNFSPSFNAEIMTTMYLGILNGTTAGSGTCITSNCANVGTPHINRVFDVIPVRPLSVDLAYNPTTIIRGTPLIRAGQIFVTADIIDINGPIIAGRVDNWSVNLGAGVASQIAGFKAQYAAGQGTLFQITTGTAVNANDNVIRASYDAVRDQVVLDKVTSGVAGYVYLNGSIVSSNTFGNIQVNAGYSNVTVNNTTGTAIATGAINAGQAVPGVVQIVDRAGGGFSQSAFNTKTTWYVYTPGAALPLSIYTAPGSSVNDYTQATRVGSALAGASSTYSPLANVGLTWVEVAQLKRSFSTGSNGLPSWSATAWQWDLSFAPGLRTDKPYVTSQAFLDIVPANQAYFHQDIFVNSLGNAFGITNNYNGNNGVTVNNIVFVIPREILVNLYNTVRADAPIGVQFISNGTGSVTINSNAAVTVGGAIDNATGTTAVTATSILQGAGGVTGGNSVILTGAGGIGTVAAPLAVSLTGGTLTANASAGDISIAANGGLRLNAVNARGNVRLTATNDIVSAGAMNLTGTPTITGKNISLATTGGAIGAKTGQSGGNPVPTDIQPLVLQATPVTLANGTTEGGVISASATTAVYLVQQNGDFRVGEVTSNGAVFLMAAGVNGQTANLVNGVVATQDTATQARLAQVWADLNLTGNDGTAAVRAYESIVNRNYQEYLQYTKLLTMLSSGLATDQAAALSVIKAQQAAQTGAAVNTITDSAALTYAQNRIATLTGFLTPASFNPSNPTTAYVTPGLTAALASLDASFRYTLPTDTAAYANFTTGSQWTLSQLTYSINSSAISGGTAPTVSQLPLNVDGRQVMLYAPTGSIGSTAPNLTVSFTTSDFSALTSEIKAKLTLAGPGDLTVQTTTDSNNVTHYTFGLKQTNLVVAGALGPVSAKAMSNIFIGGETDLLLGGADGSLFPTLPGNYAALAAGVQSTNGGEVRIVAGHSILNGVPGQVVISGNISLLNLIAETGSIGLAGGGNPGSNPNAIIAALTGSTVGYLDSARAANGIYFRQAAGDLVVGNLFGGNSTTGVIQLAATGSIYAEPQFTDRSAPHILGRSLDLRAANGAVGYNGASYQPLQVSLTGGVLTGNALGDFAVLSPTTSLVVGTAGIFGGLTAGGLLTLSATGGDLTIARSIVGPDSVSLTANQTLIIAAGTPASPVTVSSTFGSVDILAGVLAMQADTAINAATNLNIITTGALTAKALTSTAGNIFASAAGDASFTTAAITNATGAGTITLKSTGGALSLDSASGPGAVELDAFGTLTLNANGQAVSRASTITVAAGSLDMQAGSQMSAATGIHIETVGVLSARTLTTAAGDLFALAGGDATFTTAAITNATGTGAITLKSTGGALSLDSASGPGAVELDAFGTLTLNAGGQAVSRASTITVAAGSLDMRAGSQMSAATGIHIVTVGALSARTLTTAAGDLFASAGGDATFTTAAITATTGTDKITLKSTGGALSLDNAGGQGAIELGALGRLTLNANGQASSRGGNVTVAAGSLDMQAGTQMSAATGIHIETVGVLSARTLTTAAGDLFASAGGDATFTTAAITATTGTDKITLKSTGGALSLDNAGGQGAIELGAFGTLTLNANGQASSRGGNVTLAAGALDMQAGSQMSAATGIHIVTVGALTAKALTTTAGDLFASAGGDAAFTTVAILATTGTDKVTLKSTGGALSLDSASGQGAIELGALGTLTLNASGQASSRGGNVAVEASSLDMQAGSQMSAATGIHIETVGALSARTLTTAAGDLFASAGGDATFTTAAITATTGTDKITLKSIGGALSLDSASGQGEIELGALGTLTLNANGQASSRGGNVTLAAGALDMQAGSQMSAATGIHIVTVGALSAKALTTAAGDLFVSAGGDATFTTAAITNPTGAGAITLKSTGGALSLDSASGPGAVELDAFGTLTFNAGGQATSRTAGISVTAGALDMQAGSQMSAATGIHIETVGALTAKTLTTTAGDLFASAGGDATFTTVAILATTGTDKVTLKSTGGALSLDSASGQGAIELGALGTLTLNASGQASSRGGNVAVEASSLDMQAGSQMSAATGIHIETVGALSARTLTTAAGDLFASAGGDATFTTAAITATTGTDKITLKSIGGALSLDSASGQGEIELGALGTLTLNANGRASSRGGNVAVAASSLDMQAGTQMSAATGIHIETVGALTARTLTTAAGDLFASAGGDATFTTAAITATTGTDKITLKSIGGALNLDSASGQGAIELGALGTLTLNASGQASSRGGNVAVAAGALDMRTGSQMSAATGIHIETVGALTARMLTTAAGDLFASAGGDATFTTAAITNPAGTGAITLKSTGGALSLGSVTGPGAIELDAFGLLTLNASGQATSRAAGISVTADALDMRTGSQMSAATGIHIETVGVLSARTLTTAAGDLFASAGGDATFTTAAITNATGPGTIMLKSTGGALSLDSASGPGAVELDALGTLTLNANGQALSRASTITVAAGSLDMKSGSQLSASAQIEIHTSGNLVAETLLSATGDITVKSDADAAVKTASIADAVSGTILFETAGSLDVGSASAAGEIRAIAGGAFRLTGGGQFVSRTHQVNVDAGLLVMGLGSSITAADRIGIVTTGDAVLGRLTSTLDPGANASLAIAVRAGRASVAGAILGNGDGQINLKTLRPNAAILLAATNGIGTVSASIKVDVPILNATAAAGDINIESIGDIKIPLLLASLGSTNIGGTGSFAIDNLSGRNVTLNSQGDVDIGTITATNSVSISASSIHADIVQPNGSAPLTVNFSGPGGGVAQNIVVDINAPGGTNFTRLFATDASITTNGRHVGIQNGFITGRLELNTPSQDIVLDNRSPVPTVGPSVQLYGPGQPFTLIQDGNALFTTGFVVAYGVNSAVTALGAYEGMSFIRDIPRDTQNGEPVSVDEVTKGGKTFYVIGLSPSAMLDGFAIPKSVESIGTGPAVNLDGLW